MYTIKGGFSIENGKMTKESKKKIIEAMGQTPNELLKTLLNKKKD